MQNNFQQKLINPFANDIKEIKQTYRVEFWNQGMNKELLKLLEKAGERIANLEKEIHEMKYKQHAE